MTSDRPTLRIGLTWHSLNSDNLGVGALTLAHMVILQEIADGLGVHPQFVIMGWTDPKPFYSMPENAEVVNLRMKDFIKPKGGLFSQFRACDLVFDIGAGDSFADIYGTKRFGTVWASKAICLMAGRPLILSPQTIGPFNKPLFRAMAKWVMRRATALASRDDLSTAFLRTMYDGPIIEASDVALRLPFDTAKKTPSDKIRVGLNVSGLLFNGGYNRDNQFGLQSDYAALIRRLVTDIAARDDVELHLVGHVISDTIPVEDDYQVCQALAAEFPGTVLAPKFADPIAAKTYISGMDFFAGARMHACIAAFSSGVPVLPMAYSRKFAGLFGSMGYDLLADCQADEADVIVQKFFEALEARDHWAAQAKTALAKGRARLKLYEDAATAALKKAASK